MAGARLFLSSFQSGFTRSFQGSFALRYGTIIKSLEGLDNGAKSGLGQADDAFLERKESGGQASCSGAVKDAQHSVKPMAVPESEDGLLSEPHLIDAIARKPGYSQNGKPCLFQLPYQLRSPWLQGAEAVFKRPVFGSTQMSLDQGLHVRPAFTILQKAGFATGPPAQPVPSPLQMLPSPVSDAPEDDTLETKRTQCVVKGLSMSPYKLNLVARLVRGMSVQEALDQLEASPKRAAVPVYKAVHSARANAGHSHGMDTERLVIEKCFVGHGSHLKRTSHHAKGRGGVRRRMRAHLTVIVKELEAPKAEKLKQVETKRYHPTQLRWVDRPKRAQTWVEQLTARALEKRKQALDKIGSPAPR